MAALPGGDARPAHQKVTVFKVDEALDKVWSKYMEQNDEKHFRRFVSDLIKAWEQQVCPNWQLLVAGRLQGHREEGPLLQDLPDELLVACSKFLFITKDEAEQGEVNRSSVGHARDIVKCLTILCRHCDNIPLVSSMDFISLVTQIASLLLRHLLEMESAFFGRGKVAAEVAQQKLRAEIDDFIIQSCHLLESIYDPYLRWRTFLGGKDPSEDEESTVEIPPTPVALHQETIPFLYESFETALVDQFPTLAEEMLTVFGAVISGARHNAIKAISPATTKMILKTVRESGETSENVHIAAIYCSAKSIQIFHEMPMDERQLDISLLIEQYQQILLALAAKDNVSLATMVEGVGMISKMLSRPKGSAPLLDEESSAEQLQALLARHGMIETLLQVVREVRFDSDRKQTLLPVAIGRMSLMLRGCDAAKQRMAKMDGYAKLFEAVSEVGPPDSGTLKAILCMATHSAQTSGDDWSTHDPIVNIEPVSYLLRWMRETEYEDYDTQTWLAECLHRLCSSSVQNKMLCCQSGVLLQLIECLKAYRRLHHRTAVELLKLIESLGSHSIGPYELKQLITLLRPSKGEDDEPKFPYRSHVIHVISSMARRDGYEACRRYFDIGKESKGITIPTIREWQGPVGGFTFHCWLRLDNLNQKPDDPLRRRQLYSLYGSSGNGFEAFVTQEGVLVVAVAHKKEFLAVPLGDIPLGDERWHCVGISHSLGKRPFGSSSLCVFVDGTKRLECSLKYPALNGEPVSYCQIGSPLHRGNVPALNVGEVKHSFKEGIMDAIKVGIPGVITLPGALKQGGGSNDPHVKWTLIGLEDQLWGRPTPLCGQLGAICCFQDAITSAQAKLLQLAGPNRSLLDFAGEAQESTELHSRLVFHYSARACQNGSCPNLHTPSKYEAQVTAEAFSTQDVKDVINCIGGVQALFPLLETAAASSDEEAVDTSYLSLRDESEESLKDFQRRGSVLDPDGTEWEMLPSSSFSDWKLEQNAISGFLTLVKNLVSGHTINKEQLMRGGGVAIIGSLLQEARPSLIDVNVLMACQLLVELFKATDDQRLLQQIYHSVLFNFRIWARSEFHVQIGHVQYLSAIVKDDRKAFRRKFGVQFFLDVIRKHYPPPPGNNSSGSEEVEEDGNVREVEVEECSRGNDALSEEDCKTIRAALFSLIKFYLQRDVSAKDVHPLVAFLLSERNEPLLKEATETITHYLDNKNARDQVFLIMYERKRADLLYCQLLSKNFSPSMRRSILRLISSLLRTSKVSLRHKYRMHLADVRYLGFLHMWFRKAAKGECAAITREEVLLLIDQMLLFEHPVSYQGVLGLAHQLQWSDTATKLEVARRIMTCLFAKPDVPQNFARQIGWQECLAKLLVKKFIKPDTANPDLSIDESVEQSSPLMSPTHLIEMATTTAKQYLPQHAGDALEYVGSTVGAVVSGTHKKVASNVGGIVSSTYQATQEAVASKTQQILDRVHTGIEDLKSHTTRRRVNSTSSNTSDLLLPTAEEATPRFLQANDLFGFEDLTLMELTKSHSGSSDDISNSRADTSCSTPTRNAGGGDDSASVDDIPDIEMVNAELAANEASKAVLGHASSRSMSGEEEELCQLVINILFTIMWRGLRGAGAEVIKERGQVIACINMLGLNNELYLSHVELKRRLIEQCVQAVLSDHRETLRGTGGSSNAAAAAESAAAAQHVMQWVYDLVVLDQYSGDFGRKVTETLLDGVLALVELLVERHPEGDETWEDMAKMAFDVLLKCAKDANNVGIQTMATAKLHALVLTKNNSSSRENAHLMVRLAKLMEKWAEGEGEKKALLSSLSPVMKALLEKSKDQLHVSTQLPSLNMRCQGQEFFAELLRYFKTEEWKYFLDHKIQSLHDEYRAGFLSELPREMDVFWAECYEMSKVAAHRRGREVGESKLKFQAKYVDPFGSAVRAEAARYNNGISQLSSHSAFIKKRWQISKRLFFGPRGTWYDSESTEEDRWKLGNNENHLRMRTKLVPNLEFDPHTEASLARDNVKTAPSAAATAQAQLLHMQISKDVVQSRENRAEDGLTEEDLKAIAKEHMETAASAAGTADGESGHALSGGGSDRMAERLLMEEDCELVTLMSVVKGKLEVTTGHAYFFDCSPFREDSDRHDFRFDLRRLREMHLRRFNLRRSGIEFFLCDQTNYFLNFESTRARNRVFSRFTGLRLPAMVSYGSSRSTPAELLKASGLTQRWVNREVSNFEYLMHLNTIAGRSFNDLSQYPVFPWVLRDYESKTLDLTRPEVFRDLSKPVGVQNPKHEEEVKAKYEAFEDPSGVIAKFHYGTHYSNSAMVVHYLVRMEPFTSLHIELQSNRFDVADRQFHSVPQTWKSIISNMNDVKELIPEFFYLPEFLENSNRFDLGRLQGGKKQRVDDVILPRWASNPQDFIRKHRMALESDYVSANLNHWIDLIFGHKQQGEAAVKALNVFYYCSYEGAVNLDAITDTAEREAVEGMINNFGQTPCQLLKEPHPRRMTFTEHKMALAAAQRGLRADLFSFPSSWRAFAVDAGGSERDPLVFAQIPRGPHRSPLAPQPKSYVPPDAAADFLVTISRSGMLRLHGWYPTDKGGGSTGFTFEKDSNKVKRELPRPLTPKLNMTRKLFAVSPDCKLVFSGGHWDNSLQVYSTLKAKTVSTVVRHIDVITCLCVDRGGAHVMTGSRDNTSIVWEVITSADIDTAIQGHQAFPPPRPLQVLSGHDRSVSCVSLSLELDLAASGSEDGSVNVYSAREGTFLRAVRPFAYGDSFVCAQLSLSPAGQIVFAGHSKDVHSLHVYTANGHLLNSESVGHRITTISCSGDGRYVVTGDENGDLTVRELLSPTLTRAPLPLHLPVSDLSMAPGDAHCVAALRDGSVVIVAVGNLSEDKRKNRIV